MAEFNFDSDQIANQTLTKPDPTTQMITEQELDATKPVAFFDNLTPEQQTAIVQKVPALVDQFIADQNVLLDFGQAAVDDVNTTVTHILKEQKKIQIPQVDELLKNANKELNGFVAKYKDVSPADLEKKPNLLQKLFKQGRSGLQSFYLDAQTIEQKMDAMAAVVVKQEDSLARNIIAAQLLIEENTKSIENLVGVIAFLEASQHEATQRAQQLQAQLAPLTTSDADYHVLTNQLARTTEVVNTLEQQHTEYVSRLYVAWATSPQMRNLIKVSSDMRQKLGMLRRHTIPTMKLSIAQLGMLQQSVKSGLAADAIVNANNTALQMLAETSKEAIPAMEQSAQNPTLSVASVTALAESLVAQNKGILEAIEAGRKKRSQLEATIIKSAETINDSVKLQDKKIIEALLEEGKHQQDQLENS
ncbi:toxic anion resistance protein [Streptococcus halichoeri]|uniref:toxic anion resistance protein n=1 Tax=Streptococcus halichoeri TaxID=254785 RepID=UPI001357CC02|nr:toxic anion resistance protein [Streptococcus halichoeri]